jgi:hypothetical protein
MGGIGSGRPKEFYSTTHECHVWDINTVPRWACRGIFGEPQSYLDTTEGIFRLTWTPCTYGGERPWFVCPVCERRVAKLFSPRIRTRPDWACRHCHDLRYDCQVKPPTFAAIHQWKEARARLGATIYDRVVDIKRPKRMHWKTYRRLLEDVRRADDAVNAAFDAYARATDEWAEKLWAKSGIE